MHACIVGAGIVGLATAYELQRAGWRVTLVESHAEAGMGTSAGNGAQLSYAYVQPLADASIFKQLPKLLWASDSPLKFKLQCDPRQWAWGMSFLGACNAPRSELSTAELLSLAATSRSGFEAMRQATALDCDFAQAGKLVLLPTALALAAAQRQIDLQARLGAPAQRILNAAQAVELEPALAHYASQFAGAVYTESECVADCLAVCQALKTHLERNGMQWLGSQAATQFIAERGRIRAVRTAQGEVQADLFVSTLGWQGAKLLAPLGIHLPIYPLKGYSITVPAAPSSAAPHISITDSSRKVVFARLGERLRVAGMVELVGADLRIDPARIASLLASTQAVFPQLQLPAAEQAHPWVGMRPATPTGVPITEQTKAYRNLWVNAGHGALGFTLAFGSAHRLVEAVQQSEAV